MTGREVLTHHRNRSCWPLIIAGMLVAAPAYAQPTPAEPAPAAPLPPFPFSEAVRVGDVLYLSGQIGLAPGTNKPVAGGIPAETRQTMDNIGATLRRYGLGYEDIFKCTVMLTDMAQWGDLNRVYVSYFPNGRYPARSAMGATALALGSQVEIECMARFPTDEPAATKRPG